MSIDLLDFECENDQNINNNQQENIEDYFINNDIINNLDNDNKKDITEIKSNVDKIINYFIKELETKNTYISELEEAIRILNSNQNPNINNDDLSYKNNITETDNNKIEKEYEINSNEINSNQTISNEIVESQAELIKLLKEKRSNENVKKRKATVRF